MNKEILDLIEIIKELEEMRGRYTLTYDGLSKITKLMEDFAWETETHHPLHNSSIETVK